MSNRTTMHQLENTVAVLNDLLSPTGKMVTIQQRYGYTALDLCPIGQAHRPSSTLVTGVTKAGAHAYAQAMIAGIRLMLDAQQGNDQ